MYSLIIGNSSTFLWPQNGEGANTTCKIGPMPYRAPPKQKIVEDAGLLDRVERTRRLQIPSAPYELVTADLARVAGLADWQRLAMRWLQAGMALGIGLVGLGVAIMVDSRSDTGFLLGISGCASGVAVAATCLVFWIRRRRAALDDQRCALTWALLRGLALDRREPLSLTLDLSPIESSAKAVGGGLYRDPWLELRGILRGGGRIRYQRVDRQRVEVRTYSSNYSSNGRVRQRTRTRVTRYRSLEDSLRLEGVTGEPVVWDENLPARLGLMEGLGVDWTTGAELSGQSTSGGAEATLRWGGNWRMDPAAAELPLKLVAGLGGASLADLAAAREAPPRRRPPWKRRLAAPALTLALGSIALTLAVIAAFQLYDAMYARDRMDEVAANAGHGQSMRVTEADLEYYGKRASRRALAGLGCLAGGVVFAAGAVATGVPAWKRWRSRTS